MERNRFSYNHDTLVSTLAWRMMQGFNGAEEAYPKAALSTIGAILIFQRTDDLLRLLRDGE